MKVHPFGFALMAVIAYLTYHAVAGKQGLSKWTLMQAEVSSLSDSYEKKLQKKRELQSRISKLYPETLDTDYLEELARKKFHFVYSDELVTEPPSSTSQLPGKEELLDLSKS